MEMCGALRFETKEAWIAPGLLADGGEEKRQSLLQGRAER
jgi:hypothetical protein